MKYFKLGKLKVSTKIVLVNNIVTIIIATIFHFLFPIILNYPPDSINNDFQIEVAGLYYTYQYIIIVLFILFIGTIFIKFNLKKLDRWEEYLNNGNKSEIDIIRSKCFIYPYLIYIVEIICPVLITSIMLALIKTNLTLIYKLSGIIFTFSTLIALISHIFSNRILSNILFKISIIEKIKGTRIGLKNKIYLQVFPAFLVAILFTSLVSYSRLVTEKGDLLFESYSIQLHDKFSNIPEDINFDQIKKILMSMAKGDDQPFLIMPNGIVEPENIANNKFFMTYLRNISLRSNGHVYDYYGVDSQASITSFQTSKGVWIVGIKYFIKSDYTISILATSYLILIILYAVVLSYLSSTLAEDISRVATSLSEVVHGMVVNLDEKLPVTSNDEIGDLIVAFNKILELAKDNIETIKENQAILLEQERLASLGQLIGGIAHNLKTPIMSISGGIEALRDLAFEYRDSIGDKSVTDQDHREIAKEMMSWLDRIKPYCSYMSDVISAVKGQAVQMNASISSKFTVDELIKRVELLMKHELKKYHCILNVDSQIDMSTEIKGEVNNLVQVFDNIIINAMQAYEGQNGTIDLKIIRSGDNVEFSFKDYGKGISKEVTDKLFKEMVTTKGKNGTGLGLYMSYSTIKGRFGGNMSFTSKEGCGTTIFIAIPCIVYSNQEANK